VNHEGEIDLAALAAISPERLAAMLAEAATMLPCMQRRLYFELYVQQGGNVVTATREWIDEFSRQTSFLDAEQIREAAWELDAIRAVIVTHVVLAAPDHAPDMMWRFFKLAETVFERTAEEGWDVSCVFDEACADLIAVSAHAGTEPTVFAEKVLAAVASNEYGQYNALVRVTAEAEPWAAAYLSQLKVLLQQSLDKQPRAKDGTSGSRNRKLQLLQDTLQELSIRRGT
jgi:hypothetical protein